MANASTGVRLVDSVSLSLIMSFQCPSAAAKVHTVSWLTNAPGMFVTGGKYTCVLVMGLDTLSGEATQSKLFCIPSEKGPSRKGKNLFPMGANSFLLR